MLIFLNLTSLFMIVHLPASVGVPRWHVFFVVVVAIFFFFLSYLDSKKDGDRKIRMFRRAENTGEHRGQPGALA